MGNPAARARSFICRNGEKATLPFSKGEYERRLLNLRNIMAAHDVPAILLTSMHNIAYYTGFLYCSFGRPYGCVVTQTSNILISANIDGGQPWRRSIGENVIYTDWQRDNYWHVVGKLAGKAAAIFQRRI